MTGLGGGVRLNAYQRVTADLDGDAITLTVEETVSVNVSSVRLPFDDAEHLAGLLSDLARIVRHRAGLSRTVVA